ncbi:hypothetical protein BU16DRAFT_523605 [Lophium mytilinum]|uniref:Uncharacterized protein n=1 Tax=Lophium mytilinum TaxID=390894 RepID=A0A6A6R8P9_9PEZI|nr:hypothetical protein BU16DRAFT_523605 [Lophium mytilinum]
MRTTLVSSNKDRIYIALYDRPGENPNTYHWAIIVGPKNEVEGGRGHRYHVRERLGLDRPGIFRWQYEAVEIPLAQTNMLLARVMIGKVANGAQLPTTLATVPLVQDNPAWRCRHWVRDAIAALEADRRSLGTRVTDWSKIERASTAYVERKRQQKRYDGSGTWKAGTVPTYDLLEEMEVIP